jgi:hypothetical protein
MNRAKLAAGRERDLEFARVCVERGLCDLSVLLDRCNELPLDADHRAHVADLIGALEPRQLP